MKNTKRGFTIVELVIVIAVIAILAAILIPVFANVTTSAAETARQADIKNTHAAYVAERAEKGLGYQEIDKYVFSSTVDGTTSWYTVNAEGKVSAATQADKKGDTALKTSGEWSIWLSKDDTKGY